MTPIPRRAALTAAGSALGAALLSTTSLPVLGGSGDADSTADAAVDATSWPMHRGGPARMGSSAAADVGPAVATRFRTAVSSNRSRSAEVVVGEGLAFVTEELDDATGRSRVVAYDATTGEQRWKSDLPPHDGDDSDRSVGRVHEAPAVADGCLYVASEAPDGGGLHAFDAQTGDLLWHRTGRYRDLVLAGDLLLVEDLPNTTVEAFETASGEARWTLGFDLTYVSVLAVRDDTFVAHLDGPWDVDYVEGFALDDGSEQWFHPLPLDVDAHSRGDVPPDAAVAGDTVYYATQTDDENALVAQSLSDGSSRWNRALTADCGAPLPRMSAPVVLDGTVCAFVSAAPDADTEPAAFLVAVDAETGEREWTWSSSVPLAGAPTATGGRVYVAADVPLADAVDADPPDEPPVDVHPTVVAVDADDGSVAWSHTATPAEGRPDRSRPRTPVSTADGLYLTLTGAAPDAGTSVLSLVSTDADQQSGSS